ncbi:regulatory protein RecX [Aureimonas jatrophae]|uniref:Regulatory protein RecX n=1 Tax=Aureimonas jatrophae TaxID=1166073 RepID=A0A1H0J6Z5_9HYPH|nr:regulatory protein RecX [Aureimonas jatrophae]MBB3951561.1 regulatory protein [Aureimonas jatrophae]SDO39497.1 regulatory protein [Aureimonas jatrophae]
MSEFVSATQPPRKPPRPVSREWLFRAAAYYLERYSSSSGNLRRVLQRKVLKRTRERGEEAGDFQGLIDETVAHFVELRLLDDKAYAESRVATLRRKGTSLSRTRMKLIEKGVDAETAQAALGRDETPEAEAAQRLVRRRRLGPYRTRERAERRDRDIAAVMRAGFSFRDAVAAVDGEAEEGVLGT